MTTLGIVLIAPLALVLLALAMAVKIVKQYEQDVVLRLGRSRVPATPAFESSSRPST